MLSASTFEFLGDLAQNNDREWFQANKARYEDARGEFIGLVAQLIGRIADFDPAITRLDPRKAVFRIYRDTRFSRDKSPYKINMGAHLAATGGKPDERAGYYIHVQPGESFLAGGAYHPAGEWLRGIRAAIDQRGEQLVRVLQDKNFRKYFGEMSGEKLKTRPRDYSADHPRIELLRYKSFLAVHHLRDEELQKPDSLNHAGRVFEALKPFDDFLNSALDG